jgi:cholest-4-en-3-one 26-monooxygenase
MAARRTIIDTDPPEHTKLRKIVSGAFSLRAVAVYEHFIAGLTEPGDDLLSRLVGAEVDGERLTETDLDNFFSILVVAGNETTRIAIAQGVLAFCQYPDQWDRLRADPGLLETATDEVIRWSCPTHFMRRTAAADTELGGAAIRAGDKVVLWYVSGNRDEAEFERPDAFDVGRSPNRHLSFGRGGPHLCLGVHLARLEVKVALAALARRVRRFELAGPPRRIRSNFTNGLRELPVRAYQ